MIQKYFLSEIKTIQLDIKTPCIIFLRWDLASWKTTFSKHIIQNILLVKQEVISPTYTYYNKYSIENLVSDKDLILYHFDLYRLSSYDEFFAIGWDEILDNNTWIILIEWPEIIESYYIPDIEIILRKTEKEEEREIEIRYF